MFYLQNQEQPGSSHFTLMFNFNTDTHSHYTSVKIYMHYILELN